MTWDAPCEREDMPSYVIGFDGLPRSHIGLLAIDGRSPHTMKVLSFDELHDLKGIRYSRAHLYRLINAGQFPKPIKLGSNCVAFPEKEIDEWVASKVAERDAKLKVA